MSQTVISVEHLSKSYRLGQIGTGTLSRDLEVWWAKLRGKPNPLLKIGQVDHGNMDGETLWALKDVSFTVQQGEVLGIIGRNGAGKSTLLKILSRVTAPSSGVVKVKGRIASLLEVGTGFHPDLTGRENIYLNGAILGMTKQEIARKFDEIVDFAEIEKFIDTPVKRYSSGMYVRLAFAVAAHLESEILLVDEVLAVGDAEFQKKCLGKMGDIASKEGRTVVFVSHNMGAVTALCNSAILLQHGKITTASGVKETIQEYLKGLNKNNHIALGERSDRIGNGRLHFQSFRMLDIAGNPISVIQTGENVTFELGFKLNGEQKLRDAFFQISFLNMLGERLFLLITRYSGDNFDTISSGERICCQVPQLPLLPGSYQLHLIAKQGYDLLDMIENAVTINVIEGDIFGNGKLPQSDGGNIVVKHNWFKVSNGKYFH